MKTATRKLKEARERGPIGGVLYLEEATREDMLHRPTKLDSALARTDLDARGLMRAPVEALESASVSGHEADALRNPFMHVTSTKDAESGITSHRGVLHEDEYVDADVLRKAVEEELGHTYDQIRSVYRQGPLSPEKREIRDVIDARMLALRRSGANMVELGRAIGFSISYDGHCRTIDNAISRAKAVEQWRENLG